MFLAILSHDLRNPLNAIMLTAKVANQQLQSQQTTPDPLLSSIVTSADAMSHLIDDLLDFAQSGLGGAIPVKPERFQLDALCREVVDELKHGHPNRRIRSNYPTNLVGRWDASRIRQVLSNLLSNAIQHGSPGEPVELDVAVAEGLVEIRVCNKGPVITAEQMRWIFDPLKRGAMAANVDSRAFRGSIGLGLYIARAIVEAHGGTIQVESTAIEGTCFTVRLPQGGA
jgi:signal transduction histidine kinase